MYRYVKKPVVVQAMEYLYPASNKLKSWLGNYCGMEKKE